MKRIQGGFELGKTGSWFFTAAAGYGIMSFVFDCMRLVGWL